MVSVKKQQIENDCNAQKYRLQRAHDLDRTVQESAKTIDSAAKTRRAALWEIYTEKLYQNLGFITWKEYCKARNMNYRYALLCVRIHKLFGACSSADRLNGDKLRVLSGITKRPGQNKEAWLRKAQTMTIRELRKSARDLTRAGVLPPKGSTKARRALQKELGVILSIYVMPETKDRLLEFKKEGQSWDQVMTRLLDCANRFLDEE